MRFRNNELYTGEKGEARRDALPGQAIPGFVSGNENARQQDHAARKVRAQQPPRYTGQEPPQADGSLSWSQTQRKSWSRSFSVKSEVPGLAEAAPSPVHAAAGAQPAVGLPARQRSSTLGASI